MLNFSFLQDFLYGDYAVIGVVPTSVSKFTVYLSKENLRFICHSKIPSAYKVLSGFIWLNNDSTNQSKQYACLIWFLNKAGLIKIAYARFQRTNKA